MSCCGLLVFYCVLFTGGGVFSALVVGCDRFYLIYVCACVCLLGCLRNAFKLGVFWCYFFDCDCCLWLIVLLHVFLIVLSGLFVGLLISFALGF